MKRFALLIPMLLVAACASPMPRPVHGDSCRAEEGPRVAARLAGQCSEVAISRVACTGARSCDALRREIDRGCAAIAPGDPNRPRFCAPTAR